MEGILQQQSENIVNDLLQKLLEVNQQNLRHVLPHQPRSHASSEMAQTLLLIAATTESHPAAAAGNTQMASVSAAAALRPDEFDQILGIAAAAKQDALQLPKNEADDPVTSDDVYKDPMDISTDVVQQNAETDQVQGITMED